MEIIALLVHLFVIYVFDGVLDFIHALIVTLGHYMLLVPELFIVIGLFTYPIHGALELVDSISHFKFMVQVLCLVAICPVIVLFAELFILLDFLYLF